MISIEYLGFTAGAFVAISLLPQLVKAVRTKSTLDISITWSLINEIGQILWIIYGAVIQSQSLVIMSSITLLMNTFLIMLKIRYDKMSKKNTNSNI